MEKAVERPRARRRGIRREVRHLGQDIPMKALVLGAGGFLGRNLCSALVDRGINVRGIGRSLRSSTSLRGVEFLEAEVSDTVPIAQFFDDVDVVFHLLGPSSPHCSHQNRKRDFSQIVGSTWAMLEACVEVGVERVVFASSGGTVYGRQEGGRISETAEPRPISSYGLHKLIAEQCLALFNRQYGLRCISLRISNAFGPFQRGDNEQGIVSIFGRKIIASQAVTVFGDGSASRDFVYIEDVCRAFIAAARYHGDHNVFNIGQGQSRSVRSVLRALEKALGRKAIVRHAPPRLFDLPTNELDTRSAQSELGWRAQIPWDEGIEKTAEWLRLEYGE